MTKFTSHVHQLMLATALLCLQLPLAQAARNSPADDDELRQWVEQQAIAVRSVDPRDEDFSDLEPLIAAIGDARVVQLGEPGHGAGTSFAAKARLIKFLHQRLGFDVVLWESGMFDVRQSQIALRGGEDPAQAAQRGIFSLWSATAEARPLFDYAQASLAGTQPLEMAGFDMQFSGTDMHLQYFEALRAFMRPLHDGEFRTRITALTEEAIARYNAISAKRLARSKQYDKVREMHSGASQEEKGRIMGEWEASEGARLSPQPADLESFLQATNALLEIMDQRSEAFAQAHGMRETKFMRHTVENFRNYGTTLYERNQADQPTGAERIARSVKGWNRRDTRNGEILRWQLEDYYRDRKIIIWAHNGHVMNAYYSATFGSLHAQAQPGGAKPSGSYLKDWYGDQLYTIGFTTYAGEDSWVSTDQVVQIPPPDDGTLEYHLHSLAKPYLFLDFTALADKPGHPMHRPQAMRIRGYGSGESMPDLTHVFDAVFYTDHMAPPTPLKSD